ncbi:hypothetical protein CA260_10665 [Dyella jiangningensis]|uniref:Gp5/Type VI secretion system Vgr protein OB-fold domain-containing protein n=2 Tax=Dyella jiangningensis TaxID=1379159 RepID=A0A328PE46_9GAMM|nr:hypothetical protein CA260_10665 [Dyella jiangningensis]
MAKSMPGQALGGVMVAQVSRVDDPEGLGRVIVLLQGGDGPMESGWLPVMSFYGGPDGGAFFLPKEGDSVLVGFAAGDARQAFVLGFLWNGGIKPPIEDAARHQEVRVIKTRQGKQLIFDDSKEGQLTLIDEHQNKVQIDSAKNHIAVESKGDVTITAANTMTLRANKLMLQNSSGTVRLELGANGLQAIGGASMKLSAAVIDLN